MEWKFDTSQKEVEKVYKLNTTEMKNEEDKQTIQK